MQDSYKIVFEGGEGEIVEKKSRFIATFLPVDTEEEAFAFIEKMKKKYWDASHNCFAFVIGKNQELMRFSDDGEPQGTAGKPMLDVLLGSGVHNTAVVVTRYFGGTLLGTGGLVRAYQSAVQEGLKHCTIVEKCFGYAIHAEIDYNGIGKVQYLLGQRKIPILASDYAEQVSFKILAPAGEKDELLKVLTEGTNGRIQMEVSDPFWYMNIDGEILTEE